MMKELSLKEIQSVSLEILKDVHKFCTSNSLNYSLAYGSLIGAIRHKGFIPWDDDVDIMMPRPAFEKFCKLYKSDEFELIYYGNDSSALACFARVVDCKKTVYKTERPWTNIDSGMWIDIFPIDGVEEKQEDYSRRYNGLKKWLSVAYKYRRQNHHIVEGDSLWSIIKTYIARIISLNGIIPAWIIRKMVRDISMVDYEGAKYVGQCTCLDDGPIRFDKEDFSSYVMLPYEDTEFMAIKGYDHNLKQLYGDYMQLPLEKDRCPKQYWIKFYWRE